MTDNADDLLATRGLDPLDPSSGGARLVAVLRGVLSERETVVWLSTGSAWLSGDVPIDVVTTDPERAITAAQRFVSNVA